MAEGDPKFEKAAIHERRLLGNIEHSIRGVESFIRVFDAEVNEDHKLALAGGEEQEIDDAGKCIEAMRNLKAALSNAKSSQQRFSEKMQKGVRVPVADLNAYLSILRELQKCYKDARDLISPNWSA